LAGYGTEPEEVAMSAQMVPVEAEFTLLKSHLKALKQRSAVRYRCNLATLGRLYFPISREWLDSWVHNLSVTGIGLDLERCLEVGTRLVIRLKGPSGGEPIQAEAQVIHTTQEVDGTWRVGCSFQNQLTPEDLDTLL
jgi:hypothetical protein